MRDFFMARQYQTTIYLFHRSLRLHDNLGLIAALKNSEKVIPCFIFDPKQVKNNEYKSENLVRFMIESLEDLNEQLKTKQSKLYTFYGKPESVLNKIIQETKSEAIYLNGDYTPFAKKRLDSFEKLKLPIHVTADYLLTEPEEIKTDQGTPYTVFTPFSKKAKAKKIPKPQKNSTKNYYSQNITGAIPLKNIATKILKQKNNNIAVHGGRKQAIKLLKKAVKLKNYKKDRDFPYLNATTHLSAHHKFGTLSIRESYHHIASRLGRNHQLITELFWRDFFTHICYHFPHVIGAPFRKKYTKIKWSQNKKHFDAWCKGKTGFPIVDAGMRELNATGYMHNRVRMIVASFLVKDLHIDWRKGEKYFAQKLVDYDISVNNGNWQWAASTGTDAQPFFRIFNPWLQQKKYDKDAKYIKKWVPELDKLPAEAIHKLYSKQDRKIDYPSPIVNHKQASNRAKEMYKKIPD